MTAPLEATLARARAAAEALMVDTCVVERRTGETTDRSTGVVTPTWSTVYSGPCKVQQATAVARPEVIGEATRFVARYDLHLPMSVTGIASDDRVTVTASVHDPDLAGRTFALRELAHKTWATARRMSMVEVTS